VRKTMALALVCGFLATGCASVPTSGPIQQGAVLDTGRDDQVIRVIARPPRSGMTPVEVVKGFLEASAGGAEGLTIAREYLTARRADSWAPEVGVRVYDDAGLTFEERSARGVDLSGGLTGLIDGRGDYSLAAPAQVLRAKYALVNVAGEWRIDVCPDGLILSGGDIARGFRTLPTYFLDPTFSTLVPNPITVPVVGAGLATTVVRSLLKGPTAWLAPSVKTAFPEGTTLAIDSVPVDSGVAQVDLTREVLSADDKTRQAMSAQLVWSLRSLTDVTGVRITVAGQPFAVPGVSAVQPTSSWATYSPDSPTSTTSSDSLFVAANGAVSRLDVGVAGEVTAPKTPPAPLPGAAGKPGSSWSGPAVSVDGRQVAVLGRDATTLWSGRIGLGQPLVRRITGLQLSAPSWDRFGGLWTVDRDRGVKLIRVGRPVLNIPVLSVNSSQGLAGLNASDVVGIALSSDGMRAALQVRLGGHTLVVVARVERRGDDVRLADPRRIEAALTDVTDAAWASSTDLAILGTSGAAEPSLLVADFGPTTSRVASPPAGAVALAAAPQRPLAVATQLTGATAGGRVGASEIWIQVAGSWVLRAGGSDPAY